VQIDWLEGLESRVHDAVEQLGKLREENRSLRDTVKDLESRLAAAPPSAPTLWEGQEGEEVIEVLQGRVRDLERQLAEAAATAKGWQAEREEVRRRVEALTARLEGLVAG
jgi:chromosome segregation ATPase